MEEFFIGIALASNSSTATICSSTGTSFEIISLERCTPPLPNKTWNFTFGLTKLIGLPYDDKIVQRISWQKELTFDNVDNVPKVACGDPAQKYTIAELTTMILKEIKRIAETENKGEIQRAMLAVPDNFSNIQKLEVTTAAYLAGFEFVDVVNELVAAAHRIKSSNDNCTVLICKAFEGYRDSSLIVAVDASHTFKIACETDCRQACTDRNWVQIIKKRCNHFADDSSQIDKIIVYGNLNECISLQNNIVLYANLKCVKVDYNLIVCGIAIYSLELLNVRMNEKVLEDLVTMDQTITQLTDRLQQLSTENHTLHSRLRDLK